MPKAFPKEFRNDVIAVARRGDAPISRIAKDFGVSESCLQRWLKIADVEDGIKPGVTQADATELREARKRIRLLEQRTRSSAGRLRICRKRHSPNDVPAGP